MRLFICLLSLLLAPYALLAQAYMGMIALPPQNSPTFIEHSVRNLFEDRKILGEETVAPQLLLSDASFVLAQATICPDWEELQAMKSKGIKTWIHEQIDLPSSFVGEKVKIWQLILEEQTNIDTHTSSLAFQLANWQNALTAKDQLRQRMAWALDEVLKKTLHLDASYLSAEDQGRYADLLIKHALGNYQDLLFEILADSSLRESLNLNENGEKEIKELFTHPHTGYQIADALIQELLGQKPEYAFIQRVASVFDENEYGERGDLAAVAYSILSDSQAFLVSNPGKPLDKALVIEPLLKYTYMCDFLNQISPAELLTYFEEENRILEEGEEVFFGTSDLLSFYYPSEESWEELETEANISQAQLMLNFIKEVELLENNTFTYHEEANSEEKVSEDLDELIKLSENPVELLDYLDILLVQGLLSDTYKNQIIETITQIPNREDRFAMALYLIFISPDYKNLP